jgi:1-aminocyclopropane-1-carboxylate deaminase
LALFSKCVAIDISRQFWQKSILPLVFCRLMNAFHDLLTPISTDKVRNDLLAEKQIELSVLRLDKMHHWISGNKYFKLKYNLQEAIEKKYKTILTFGGAFSNHIVATAAAGKMLDLKTIGIIRGEKTEPLNSSLTFAESRGMNLNFISRNDYQKKDESEYLSFLKNKFGDCFIIPEGGSNKNGVRGCTEILNYCNEDFDVVSCSCGTGTMLSGIILSLKQNQKAIGFSVFKNGAFLNNEIEKRLTDFNFSGNNNYEIKTDYHFGGYGKINDELVSFYKKILKENNIELDLVYTAKMMFGIFDLIGKNHFQPKTKILAIHSGGVQGNHGFHLSEKE